MQCIKTRGKTQTHFNRNPSMTRKNKKKIWLMRTKKTREKMENALSFRTPMEVSQIKEMLNGDCFPVCPQCKITIEREYMNFCDRCGQKLSWKGMKDAAVLRGSYPAR